MFISLLLVTLLIAMVTSFIIAIAFNRPVMMILEQIVSQKLSQAWLQYLRFAIVVVGISSGVRVWDLEKYITPVDQTNDIVVLNSDRWILEIYRTVISTLTGIAWLLLVFFLVGLLAYVLTRFAKSREISQ